MTLIHIWLCDLEGRKQDATNPPTNQWMFHQNVHIGIISMSRYSVRIPPLI